MKPKTILALGLGAISILLLLACFVGCVTIDSGVAGERTAVGFLLSFTTFTTGFGALTSGTFAVVAAFGGLD